jgi:hypothetical protein
MLSAMASPPPLPNDKAKVLSRVLRLAGLEGKSVIFLAGCSVMLAAIGRDWPVMLVSGVAVWAGMITLQGTKRLGAGDARGGMDRLVRGELVLLAAILSYVGILFFRYATGGVNAIISDFTRTMLDAAGHWGPDDRREYAHNFKLFYGLLAALSVVFQGGLALYYHRRRAAVAEALALLPVNNPLLTACPVCHKTVSRTAPMCPHCGHPRTPTAAA